MSRSTAGGPLHRGIRRVRRVRRIRSLVANASDVDALGRVSSFVSSIFGESIGCSKEWVGLSCPGMRNECFGGLNCLARGDDAVSSIITGRLVR